MSQHDFHPPEQNIEAGVQALRAGKREKAKEIFTQIVTADENNEAAWFWLAQAVEYESEQKICLENVLTLNPNHQPASEMLAALHQTQAERTAAAASSRMRQTAPLSYEHNSEFDDVWTHADELDLCAYCAQEVDAQTSRCPNCRRKLSFSFYRYENPSPNFHVFWVLLLGLSQLFMIQTIIDLMTRASALEILLHGAMVPILIILTFFVYRRQFWAFVGAMVALFSAAALLATSSIVATSIAAVIAPTTINTPLAGLSEGAAQWARLAVRGLQAGAIGFALYYGFFIVSPDFMRDQAKLLARLNKGINSAGRAFAVGNRFQQRKMWAAAVLHWRKALALDPSRLDHYLALAHGFEQLKFYDRSLDVLKSAERMISTAEAQTRIDSQRNRVTAKIKKSSK